MEIKKDELKVLPYSLENSAKFFVKNEKFSDVCFLVGAEQEIFYAHKLLLAFGSEVFEKMLFGDQRMDTTNPIPLPSDPPVGFLNMLKYLYGHKIGDDFNLSEIAETYTVADKYLVVGLNDVLFNHIKESLDIFNCCLIYDQLFKIQKDDLPVLKHVKSFIKYNTKKVVEHEFFTKIDENTLLDLLMMDELSVSEIELLKACDRWVNEELLREGLISNTQNKREIFKPIKNYIKFSVLTIDQMKGFGEIYDLLPVEETSSFLAHLLNGSIQLPIECKTKRKTINLYRIVSSLSNASINLSQFVTSISANQTCFIQMFSTSLHKSIAFLELSIEKNGKELKLNFEKKLIDDYWCFNFEDGFEMNSDVNYKLIFTFNQAYFGIAPNKLNNYTSLVQLKPNFVFNLTSSNDYHCIEKIDFYVYEN